MRKKEPVSVEDIGRKEVYRRSLSEHSFEFYS